MPTSRNPLNHRHRFPPEVISYAALIRWTVPRPTHARPRAS